MSTIKSAYIHIPFCKKICSYCDFCKMYYNDTFVSNYLNALEKEIKTYYKNDLLDTIYIGGGTPSSLSIIELKKLFNILDIFRQSNKLEYTFEANIDDINEELLSLLKENGINRLSIGIETINDKFFKLINRSNNESDVLHKIKLAKKYFNNINVDFMYGFYNETMDDLNKDLEFFKKLDVQHISIYSLILEEHTKLYIDKVKSINEEKEAKMYFHIIDYLEKLGYHHYEISNFSKDGFSSCHNLTYWNNEEYYGFGLGASGFINNIRYTNTRSINNYVSGKYHLEEDVMNHKINMENEMILGLRKIDGVNKSKFKDKYHVSINEAFDIEELLKNKLLLDNGNYIYIPKDKLYISNSILVNFIDN